MNSFQKLLVACSIVVASLMLIAIIGGAVFFVQFFQNGTMFMNFPFDEDLGDPRIETGEGLFEKTTYLTNSRLGPVTDIVTGEFNQSPESRLTIVSNDAVVVFDKDREVVSTTDFDGYWGHVVQVDVEGDGAPEYLDTGGGWQDVGLLDRNGKTLWTYGGGLGGVNSLCPCDVDGDGVLEFAVGLNGSGGVHLLDGNGKRIWRKSGGNIWHVECLDLDGDGATEILHSDASGNLIVRDGNGRQINSISSTGSYVSDFTVCTWPGRDGTNHVLVPAASSFSVLDPQGNTVATLEAPILSMMEDVHATFVRFDPCGPDYFAVLVDYSASEQSVLNIYDETEALVYCEVLGGTGGAIAALALEDGSTEALLVGSTGVVYKYVLSEP